MSIHTRLEELYDQDTQDRVQYDSEEIDESTLRILDQARFDEASALLARGEIDRTEIWNLHYLCLIYMHSGSENPEVYKQAHEFARQAVGLGSNVTRWLFAASLDRWLISQGKPQKYGTQYDTNTGEILPTDASTSDEERAAYGVPPLAKLLENRNTN